MLITGSVQTFTAPVDGIYQFELWGSPGGGVRGGAGGYTKMYISVKRSGNKPIYVFVGGSGMPITGNATQGGYNGGGAVTTCFAGPHSGSGGGMTHISYTNNLAVSDAGPKNRNGYWDPTGTIGCAGGGGAGNSTNGGVGGGQNAGNGSYDNRWGPYNHFPKGATQTSGYKQGIGEPCANSGGGGGGWYGGKSTGQTEQTDGGRCAGSAGGGSGYICDAGKLTSYTPYNLCLPGNDASIPAKPNAGTDLAKHGYMRVLLMEH